mmetsp:Transcript_19877/g.25711  ORF Transcript_19877/g.25711 Transcript_19877/m.25711 type:complete len:515 (+) Transcript_19877:96-1640(+)
MTLKDASDTQQSLTVEEDFIIVTVDTKQISAELLTETIGFDEALEKAGSGAYQRTVLFLASLYTFGYGAAIVMVSYVTPCAEDDMKLNAIQTSTLGGMIFVGQLFGNWTFGPLADYFGRKILILVNVCLMCCATIGIFFSDSYGALLILLTLIGFGTGGNGVNYSLVAEVLPKDGRGASLILLGIMWAAGAVTMSGFAWLGMGMLHMSWHYLTLMTATPYLVVCIGTIFFVLESPRWLYVHGKTKECLSVLQKTAHRNGIAGDFAFTLEPFAEKTTHQGLLKTLCDRQTNFPTVSLCFVGMVATFSHISLLLIVPFFMETQQVEGGCDFAYGDIFWSSLSEPVFSILSIWVIEKSRRIPNMLSLLGSSVLLIVMGCNISSKTFVIVSFLCRGLLGISNNIYWAIVPEYYPTRIRASVNCVMGSFISVVMFCAPYWVYDFGSSKFQTCALISALCISAVITIFFFLGETAGAQLDSSRQNTKTRQVKTNEGNALLSHDTLKFSYLSKGDRVLPVN